jgi:hypothetical protein
MSELGKIQVTPKTGNEELTLGNKGIGTSINHFWRWSVSDLLSNATRGVFAEFIVATATGIDTTQPREEWSAFDLTTPDGITLEIKSAAYLQSWNQRELSKISFSTKLSLYWDSTTNKQETVAKRHADVYVFCLLHHEDKQTVDPLNLDQWEFYVLATKQLNEYERSQHSISLKSLKRLTSPVSYGQLREEIERKYALNGGKPPAPFVPEMVATSNILPRDAHYRLFFDCETDKEYFEWMRTHPNGFVTNGELNPKFKEYLVHKSGCWHIADELIPGFSYTTNGKVKVCSNEMRDVTNWLNTNRPNGGKYRACGRCKPF